MRPRAVGGPLTGLGLHSRDGEMPETPWNWTGGLHELTNVLHATELFASKQLISCYWSFISENP